MEKTMIRKQTFATIWLRLGLVAFAATVASAVLSVGCSQVEGSACNPALSHDECDNAPSVLCVQPANPQCFGQAYCCKATLNADGTFDITSTDPNCESLVTCQSGAADAGSE
jgi:hypothetical protein